MSELFLENFMYAAKDITSAETSIAVDVNLQLVVVDPAQDTADIEELAAQCLRDALESGQAIITNNIVTDPADAPTTNTNFSDLKVVVALPVANYGAIYLDRSIRSGIIPKQTIDRLMRLANHVTQSGQEDKNRGELVALYEEIE
jgi:hypothetical protein